MVSSFVADFCSILERAKIKQKSIQNEVGKQYKKRSKQNGQGHANDMLVSLAGEVVQALGNGKGKG